MSATRVMGRASLRGTIGWRAVAVLASLALVPLMWLPVIDPFPEVTLWYADKWQHALVYAALTGLWFLAGQGPVVAATVATGWSLILECGQLLLPYRGFEWLDLAANGVGAMGAAAMVWAWSRPR